MIRMFCSKTPSIINPRSMGIAPDIRGARLGREAPTTLQAACLKN